MSIWDPKPVIQPKTPARKSVIQKGTTFTYNPATFSKEHLVPNFFEVKTGDEMLERVKPLVFMDRKFIFLDTETHAYYKNSHDVPPDVVRRWVGKGKTASPQDFPFCMSICDGKNAYTLYDSVENDWREIKKLKPLLEDYSIEKVIHNAKFDMHECANAKIKLVGKIHDTIITSKLANENRFSFALMDLAAKCGGITKFEYMVDAYKKQYKVADYRQIPKELMTMYANADVWNLFRVFVTEYPRLIEDDLVDLYEQELRVMMAFWAMERWGMHADEEYEKPLKDELQSLTDEAEQAMYDYAGRTFNVNSGKQLYEVMISKGVDKKLIQMSDKNNPVLDKDALKILDEVHGIEIVKKVLNFRKYEKLLGTYAIGIYDQKDAAQNVHCSVNQTEATTGRSSITKPALQTLPKKDKRIRRIFIPEDGYTMYFMDLDQVEYRLFAHYAIAKDLIEAIKNGHDVHAATAALIFHTSIEAVVSEPGEVMRGKAKTINFGLIYGQGEDLTAASLKMSKPEARRFREHYFDMIPEARPFINTVQNVIKTRGYVKNIYGRRRRLRKDDAYKGPNALIQGCAADYAKSKIDLIFRFLLAHKYKTKITNFVHDELVEMIHNSELFLVPKLRWLMSEFELFRVPITAGVEYGNPSWGQKAEPEADPGFEPLTAEEMERTKNYDVFDGSVFDLFLNNAA
jgi:DNA polymerase-1